MFSFSKLHIIPDHARALCPQATKTAQNPDALILASPSDHYIQDASQFRDSVRKGATAAAAGQIVTFGITPTRPETGYGRACNPSNCFEQEKRTVRGPR